MILATENDAHLPPAALVMTGLRSEFCRRIEKLNLATSARLQGKQPTVEAPVIPSLSFNFERCPCEVCGRSVCCLYTTVA